MLAVAWKSHSNQEQRSGTNINVDEPTVYIYLIGNNPPPKFGSDEHGICAKIPSGIIANNWEVRKVFHGLRVRDIEQACY
jgi:hypothetical protein